LSSQDNLDFYCDYDFGCAQPLDGFLLSEDAIASSAPVSMESQTSSLSDSEEFPEPQDAPVIQRSVRSLGLCEPSIAPTSKVLQGKTFLLTWSQSPHLTREIIRDHLLEIGSVSSLAIGKENHSDEGVHFHALVIFTQKIRRSPKAFSILTYPANVKIPDRKIGNIAQSVVNMWNYVLKEDSDPLIMGDPPVVSTKRSRDDVRNEMFLQAFTLATAESVEAAMQHLQESCPFDLLTRYDTIERGLVTHRQRKVRVVTPARQLSMFQNTPTIPQDWKALYLNGATGLGKTQWARALLPEAALISHIDQLRTCDFSKGVIFDDFAVSHWPVASVIHLLDWDEPRGINVKHSHVVIPPHTRKIFTFNDPFHSWIPKDASLDQQEALKRRIFVVDIFNKLF